MKKAFILCCIFVLSNSIFAYIFEDGQKHDIDYDIRTEHLSDNIKVKGNTLINVLPGGSIPEFLQTFSGSTVNVSGGTIGEITTYDNSCVNIMYGNIPGQISCWDQSKVVIKGGRIAYRWTLNADLYLFDDSQVTIYGKDFKVEGNSVPYGKLTNNGIITGTLENGESINVEYTTVHNSSILLVPEPATLFFLGLGGFIISKKRSQ